MSSVQEDSVRHLSEIEEQLNTDISQSAYNLSSSNLDQQYPSQNISEDSSSSSANVCPKRSNTDELRSNDTQDINSSESNIRHTEQSCSNHCVTVDTENNSLSTLEGVTNEAEHELSESQQESLASSQNLSDNIGPPGLTSGHSLQGTGCGELQTTITTAVTTSPNNNTNQPDNMGDENIRLEEKLRQFQNDVKKDDDDDGKGTYNPMQLSESEKQRRRNLIFDEERFEETFLKCLICREMYNDFDKLPKMLLCHHTFCMDCLYQMYRVEGEFRQSLTGVFRALPMTVKILCPTCREGILISETELKRLPNDHTIMELLSFVNQTSKNEVQYCTKHQMQPLNFFCEPCVLPVCCDCTVIDHKESKGHVVVNVDEAMEKYAPIVEQTLHEIKSEKDSLAEKREALEGAQEDIDQIQRELTNQIRKVFDGLRKLIDEREQELYDVADGEIERKRDILDGHMRVLLDRDTELNAEFNELQRAKDDKDISLIFTGQKSAQEVLARKVNVPLNSTKGFSVTFQFSSRAETLIKQQITNLGDIIFHS